MQFQSLLLSVAFAASVLAHPQVSNPHQVLSGNQPDIKDLYAFHPDQKPLHTTVLMAMAKTQATAGTVATRGSAWNDGGLKQ